MPAWSETGDIRRNRTTATRPSGCSSGAPAAVPGGLQALASRTASPLVPRDRRCALCIAKSQSDREGRRLAWLIRTRDRARVLMSWARLPWAGPTVACATVGKRATEGGAPRVVRAGARNGGRHEEVIERRGRERFGIVEKQRAAVTDVRSRPSSRLRTVRPQRTSRSASPPTGRVRRYRRQWIHIRGARIDPHPPGRPDRRSGCCVIARSQANASDG